MHWCELILLQIFSFPLLSRPSSNEWHGPFLSYENAPQNMNSEASFHLARIQLLLKRCLTVRQTWIALRRCPRTTLVSWIKRDGGTGVSVTSEGCGPPCEHNHPGHALPTSCGLGGSLGHDLNGVSVVVGWEASQKWWLGWLPSDR